MGRYQQTKSREMMALRADMNAYMQEYGNMPSIG